MKNTTKTTYYALLLFISLFWASCKEDIAVIPAPPSTGGGVVEEPEEGIDPKYADCVIALSESTFDVMTWNIEFFPKSGATTEEEVYNIIRSSQIDLIGVQEIDSETSFRNIASELGNWEVKMGNVSNSQDVGFLYNKDEITLLEGPIVIYSNNSFAFPREPVIIKVRHKNGLEAVVINLHLKCCGGSENEARRREASTLLKSYIETNYPNDAVIVLGDWNDDIYEGGNNDVFSNFMEDTENYQFADRAIAEGSEAFWSYPSFPSHIDHLMITDELFDNLESTQTLTLNQCLNTYYSTISDHRPVMMRLKAD